MKKVISVLIFLVLLGSSCNDNLKKSPVNDSFPDEDSGISEEEDFFNDTENPDLSDNELSDIDSDYSDIYFSEDFEKCVIDESAWEIFGSPLPQIDTETAIDNCSFENHGDSWCDSGAVTYDSFPVDDIGIQWYAKIDGSTKYDLQASVSMAVEERITDSEDCSSEGSQGQRYWMLRVNVMGDENNSPLYY